MSREDSDRGFANGEALEVKLRTVLLILKDEALKMRWKALSQEPGICLGKGFAKYFKEQRKKV